MGLFHLTKWYLDCVSDQGDLLIGYAALCRLGFLRLPLAGRLSLLGGHVYSSSTVTARWRQPVGIDDRICWDCPSVGVTGSWRSQAKAIRSVLFKNGNGQVAWDCFQPRGEANLTIDGQPVTGLGYVERLDMSIPVWQFGLKRLLWGRFVSMSESLIWIHWEGDHPQSLVWHNGNLVESATIGNDRIDLAGGGCLAIRSTIPLRKGSINNTVLTAMPIVRSLLPGWLRYIDEQKWLSRGELATHGTTSQGWVIHEAVSFRS